MIWIGDFNAHNPLNGSDHRNKNGVIVRGVTILQILDSITFSILRSRFDSILDFYIYFFKAQVATPFLD